MPMDVSGSRVGGGHCEALEGSDLSEGAVTSRSSWWWISRRAVRFSTFFKSRKSGLSHKIFLFLNMAKIYNPLCRPTKICLQVTMGLQPLLSSCLLACSSARLFHTPTAFTVLFAENAFFCFFA